MNDNIENQPLLYIVQPDIAPVTTKMQDTFRSSDQSKLNQLLAIQEKIDELLDLPDEIPSMTCEVITIKGSYHGKITSQDEKFIQMTLRTDEKASIAKEEIKSIHYISF